MTIHFTPQAPPPSLLPVTPPTVPAPVASHEMDSQASSNGDTGRALRTAGLATAGGGVVLGIAGALLYRRAGQKIDALQQGQGTASDLDWPTYDHAGVGLMIGGGVVLASGAALYFVGRRHDEPRASVSFGLLPGGATLSLGGAL